MLLYWYSAAHNSKPSKREDVKSIVSSLTVTHDGHNLARVEIDLTWNFSNSLFPYSVFYFC